MTATFKSITKNILSHPLPEIDICTWLLKGLIHIVKTEKKGPVKLISPIALLFKLYFHLFSRLTSTLCTSILWSGLSASFLTA